MVEMLKKGPADGAFYVDLLKNRINPGVPWGLSEGERDGIYDI